MASSKHAGSGKARVGGQDARIVIGPGAEVPDLATFKGRIEFSEERLLLNAGRRLVQPDLKADPSVHREVVEFILLDNAMEERKVCPFFVFFSRAHQRARRGTPSVWDLLAALLVDLRPATLRAYLLEIEARHPRTFLTRALLGGDDGQIVFRSEVRSSQVYASSKLGQLPALTQVPQRWDMGGLKRALANGQLVNWKARTGLTALELLERITMSNLGNPFHDDMGWSTELDPRTQTVTVRRRGARCAAFTLAPGTRHPSRERPRYAKPLQAG